MMCFGSCTSIRPACSPCVGEPVTCVALPAVVEKVTTAVPAERFVPLCSGRAQFLDAAGLSTVQDSVAVV